MESLARQRCFIHAAREAVARCPECGGFFCRECITEHEDRVLCAGCLERKSSPAVSRSFSFGGVYKALHLFMALIILWTFFYFTGQALISIPASFHEGTLWEVGLDLLK